MSTKVMQEMIAEYFKTQPVLKAWLFGSFARGEETPRSDVDILFVPDRLGKPFTSLHPWWYADGFAGTAWP